MWNRHARFSKDGTWDKLLTHLLAGADAVGQVDRTVSIDFTINRAHQHVSPAGSSDLGWEECDAPVGGGFGVM